MVGHEDEYHDGYVAMLELIWGDGFMAPGGEGNVANLVGDMDLRGKHVLDVGCGIGGPSFVLAQTYGAHVVGTDLERPLIRRARKRAVELGLSDQTHFQVVEAGPMNFPGASFDVIFSSGAFTQTEDKLGAYHECLRTLKPGGVFTCYDWMKAEGEYSDDMRYWFELEGLTYAMQTLEGHAEILRQAGFTDVEIEDCSDWYRKRARAEYELIRTELYPRMVKRLGQELADHFVENWRMLAVVCDKAELLQAYCRGRKPA